MIFDLKTDKNIPTTFSCCGAKDTKTTRSTSDLIENNGSILKSTKNGKTRTNGTAQMDIDLNFNQIIIKKPITLSCTSLKQTNSIMNKDDSKITKKNGVTIADHNKMLVANNLNCQCNANNDPIGKRSHLLRYVGKSFR